MLPDHVPFPPHSGILIWDERPLDLFNDLVSTNNCKTSRRESRIAGCPSRDDSAAAYIQVLLVPDFGVAVNNRMVVISAGASRATDVKSGAWFEIFGLCARDVTPEIAGKLDHARSKTRH